MALLDMPFDLEDMDLAEREELEALLYAQVHHASLDLSSASSPSTGHKARNSADFADGPLESEGEVDAAPLSPIVGNKTGAEPAENAVTCADSSDNGAIATVSLCSGASVSLLPENSPDKPEVVLVAEKRPCAPTASRSSLENRALSRRPAAAAAGRYGEKRAAPPPAAAEPETKTAALAAAGRPRRRPPPELIGLSSSGSSDESDEPDARVVVAPARAAAASPDVVELPAPAARRRPRTSSDLSSSESDGGPLADVACDVRLNVRGARDATPPPRDVTPPGSGPALPPPAWRRVMSSAALGSAHLRLLGALSRTRPCSKWSGQQRAVYATPRRYRLEDLSRAQEDLSDDGWEIPAQFLPARQAGRGRARYYTTLQRNRCRRCDEPGHVMASCPLPPVCHLCGTRGHAGALRCPDMFCYSCGQPDHSEQRCPRLLRPVFCALCKARGHASALCPDRWRRFHATTSASCEPVRPPSPLEDRPVSELYCWQCGLSGHHSHHCNGERYTGAASLSQQVISYTAETCPSSAVSGLVATPAQMDAVFRRSCRRQIEAESGATLTYEELGANSWLINISGSLAAAQAARGRVQEVLQGGGRPRPRPRSAPASPAHLPAADGPQSAPASPQPADDRQTALERRRLERRALREARRAERRRSRALQRQARAAAAAAAVTGEAPAGDDDEVVVVGEVRPPPPRAELVTVVSEEEVESPGSGDDAGLKQLAAEARVWRLRLLDGDDAASAGPPLERRLRRLRKRMLQSLRRRPPAARRPEDGELTNTPPAANGRQNGVASAKKAKKTDVKTLKKARKLKKLGAGEVAENGDEADAADTPGKGMKKRKKMVASMENGGESQLSEFLPQGKVLNQSAAKKRKLSKGQSCIEENEGGSISQQSTPSELTKAKQKKRKMKALKQALASQDIDEYLSVQELRRLAKKKKTSMVNGVGPRGKSQSQPGSIAGASEDGPRRT